MSRGLLAASLSTLLVIIVLVLVLVVFVVLVIIVVVVANDSSAEKRGRRSVGAWRSIGIVQDEFAATEDGFGALLAVADSLAL